MNYPTLLGSLAIDAAAIGALAYGVYYRKHRRADLPLAFVALNVGVFAAVMLLSSQHVDLALGFGLFGILSIVRLRSSAISQGEVGYYFTSLTLGLVNGLGHDHLAIMLTLDAVLVAALYALDRPFGPRTTSRRVVLEVIHADSVALRADLVHRLGSDVLGCDVVELDYVREVTVCDVRLNAAARVGRPVPEVIR